MADLYRFGNRHRRLYPGAADPGAALVKDAVQTLLGIPVHNAVVFDSGGLDGLDIVDNRTGKRCTGASVVRSLRPSELVSKIPSMVGAIGDSVTSDIPLDLVPDLVGMLPTLSPRKVVTVPITAPDYGRMEQKLSGGRSRAGPGSHGELGQAVFARSGRSPRCRRSGPLRRRSLGAGRRRQPVIVAGGGTIGRP